MSTLQRCVRTICTGTTGEPQKFGFWVSVCYAINVIIGAGFLAIPYGVSKAGLVLGSVGVMIAVWLCDISKDFLLEAMGRAEAVSAGSLIPRGKELAYGSTDRSPPPEEGEGKSDAGTSKVKSTTQKALTYSESDKESRPPVEETEESDEVALLPANDVSEDAFLVKERRFETPELCELFIGTPMKYIYLIFFCIWMVGTLWSFTAVFSSSMAANIPIAFLPSPHDRTCDINESGDGECFPQYISFLVIYAALVIPLSLMDMEEQLFLQVFLAFGRVFVMLAMVITVFVGFGCEEIAFGDIGDNSDHELYTQAFRWKGVPVLLPIAITTAIFHHTIPSIADSTKDKKRLSSVFRYAFFIVGFCYAAIGIILSMYFGIDVDSQANIHWHSYYGCFPGSPGQDDDPSGSAPFGPRPAAAKIIGTFILVFPPIDVVSVFPLGTIALGNSLLSLRFPQSHLRSRSDSLVTSEEEPDVDLFIHSAQYKRWKRFCRVAAGVPPLVGGIFVKDLGSILQVNGTIGIAIAMTIPALLWQFSLSSIDYLHRNKDDVGNGSSPPNHEEEAPLSFGTSTPKDAGEPEARPEPATEYQFRTKGGNTAADQGARVSDVSHKHSTDFIVKYREKWMSGSNSMWENFKCFVMIALCAGRIPSKPYRSVYSSWCTRFRYLPAIFFVFSVVLYIIVLVFVI